MLSFRYWLGNNWREFGILLFSVMVIFIVVLVYVIVHTFLPVFESLITSSIAVLIIVIVGAIWKSKILNIFIPKVDMKISYALLLYDYAHLKGRYKHLNTGNYPPFLLYFRNEDKIDIDKAEVRWKIIDKNTNIVVASQLPDENEISIPANGYKRYFVVNESTRLPRNKNYQIDIELHDEKGIKVHLKNEMITDRQDAYDIYSKIIGGEIV